MYDRDWIDTDGDRFIITFAYNPTLVEAIKAIPGRRYNPVGPKGPYWTVPGTSVGYMARVGKQFQFGVTDRAIKFGQSMRALLEMSTASDAEFNVEGLGGTLHPYQQAGVQYAVTAKRCFIADEMGLGKTMQAIGVAQYAKAFPMLVVCPATIKIKWQREIQTWLPGKTAVIAESSDFPKGDVVIINWDIIERHTTRPPRTGNKKKDRRSEWAISDQVKERGFRIVVFDESHYAKNLDAKRTKAAIALARNVEYRLCLSGTPLKNRPKEYISQLMLLDQLQEFGGFWGYAKRYCAAHEKYLRNKKYWDINGYAHLDELNQRLRAKCYIRRLKKDVKQELPPKTRTTVPVELSNREEYEEAAQYLIEYLETHNPEKVTGALRAEQLTKLEVLKQVAVRGKMKAVVQWIEEFLESGEKLVVFAHHHDVVNEISEYFQAPKVMGGMDAKKKQIAQDKFQTDKDCQLIVCSAAAREGIDLFAASNVAFVELWWTPADHDQAEDRCHREGQVWPVTAWYLIAEKTIDEDLMVTLDTKRGVVDAGTDGKGDISESVIETLINRLTSQGYDLQVSQDVANSAVPKSTAAKFAKPQELPESFEARRTLAEAQLLFLYARQTEDEQISHSTKNLNATGFNAIDAGFGSDLAVQLRNANRLTVKQLLKAEQLLKKYKRQLSYMEKNNA